MKRNAPSKEKEQAINELLSGRKSSQSGAHMLSELVRLSTEKVVQELLEREQSDFLGRDRYERNESSAGHRNGYEQRTLRTAEGVMKVEVPQVRGLETPYRSQLWASISNKSEVLEQIVTEMWVRGLSVRDIEEAMESATGAFVLSDSAVSQVTEHLYAQYEAFRSRDLSGFDIAYLFIDAVYEPLRQYGNRTAILCAWGICSNGSRVLLNLTTGSSESYETCIEFLRDMVSRGLNTPLTVTTDGAPGLIQAVEALWPRSKRIRCWFHKMQNLEGKVPTAVWPDFKALVIDIRDAPDVAEARRRLKVLNAQYSRQLPEACRCLLDDQEASLNHLLVPTRHRSMVRTTNLVERTFVEQRRRTKVIPQVWDEKSLLKLVFSVLIRVSERWAKRKFTEIEHQQIIQLRQQFQLEGPKKEPENQNKPKRRSASRVVV